jgi:hypothetical protein
LRSLLLNNNLDVQAQALANKRAANDAQAQLARLQEEIQKLKNDKAVDVKTIQRRIGKRHAEKQSRRDGGDPEFNNEGLEKERPKVTMDRDEVMTEMNKQLAEERVKSKCLEEMLATFMAAAAAVSGR